ncbi:LOW QUALITY PROTEIN: tumor necrosis factor receptor superfamily member 4 [Ctenodactylus gundi]
MYVKALWPATLLLLGLGLGAIARPNCVGNTYPSGHRCCHECPPGYGMASRCKTRHGDSQCLPCKPGTYNDAFNYKDCKPCTKCNERSGSEQTRACTLTQDTVCHCRPGTEPREGYKHGVDCSPCPPGHFSPGSNQPCRRWANCTLAGKLTLQPANSSTDAVCEDMGPLATVPGETQGPTARPITVQPTPTSARTAPGSSPPPLGAPKGAELAAVLGLGLSLGLLAPVATLLVLCLHHRAGRLPGAPKTPGDSEGSPLTSRGIRPHYHHPFPTVCSSLGGKSFRMPIQEEQADVHSTLAKL